MSDKGQIKDGIFFVSLMGGILCFMLMIVAVGETLSYQKQIEKLEERIQEQELLIEYLKREGKENESK